MAKFCSKCGTELKENSTTCNNCGNVMGENKVTTPTNDIQVNQTIINNKPKTNGLAVAGFVVSLVNLLC